VNQIKRYLQYTREGGDAQQKKSSLADSSEWPSDDYATAHRLLLMRINCRFLLRVATMVEAAIKLSDNEITTMFCRVCIGALPFVCRCF
jgi:hypothetical protein